MATTKKAQVITIKDGKLVTPASKKAEKKVAEKPVIKHEKSIVLKQVYDTKDNFGEWAMVHVDGNVVSLEYGNRIVMTLTNTEPDNKENNVIKVHCEKNMRAGARRRAMEFVKQTLGEDTWNVVRSMHSNLQATFNALDSIKLVIEKPAKKTTRKSSKKNA